MRKISSAGFRNPTNPGCKGENMGEVVDLGFLKGKRVVGAGMLDPEQCGDEEGTLALDYEENGIVKRAVFSYNDLGFWLEWNGEMGKANCKDVIGEKLSKVWERIHDSFHDGRLEIVNDPRHMRYIFKDNGDEIVTLGRNHLNIMGENVKRHFRGKMNLDALVEDIRIWLIDAGIPL